MVPLWRVTRNRVGKRLYARLDDAGITVSRLYEYRAPTPPESAPSSPDGVSIQPVAPDTLPESVPTDELTDDETVLAAVDDGVVGYVFVSVDATVPVPELGTDLTFDGTYLRRLYVDPDYRRRGIATGLVDAATAYGADRGADTASALVAVDNRPSQWTFESRGFVRVARHAYDRVRSFERRRRRPLPADD